MTGNFSALTNFSKPIAMSVEMSFLNQIAKYNILAFCIAAIYIAASLRRLRILSQSNN